jgi:hypothetical protein
MNNSELEVTQTYRSSYGADLPKVYTGSNHFLKSEVGPYVPQTTLGDWMGAPARRKVAENAGAVVGPYARAAKPRVVMEGAEIEY